MSLDCDHIEIPKIGTFCIILTRSSSTFFYLIKIYSVVIWIQKSYILWKVWSKFQIGAYLYCKKILPKQYPALDTIILW